jgi:hypothetical protein
LLVSPLGCVAASFPSRRRVPELDPRASSSGQAAE